ncbi:SCO0930 family lipoprotein [Streptomyces sp. GQFP]|uniref:SCO0930 family lipoprotein n=1 Tax=Streptomyces sp. GQFP TaxID=2907545 RepID=UPI001F452E15|nr:SCO0930 family lipoprotein [Streptomyces sp. GQFP]UIX31058.1 SCO0930 family lipoprotein [Streptomyces sp. GQFP]
MRKWQSISIAVTAAAIMLTSACGGSQDGAAPAGAAVSVAPSGAAATPGGAGAGTVVGGVANVAPSAAGKLSIWESAELGPVVTDSAGFTLYRFDKDTAQPSRSNCAGECATTWPPVLADDASAADGMDASLLGKVARADGTEQLTLAGWPLYRFAKDTQPRQSNGQGVGGTWFAAAPDGTKANADTASGSGYGADADAGQTEELPPLSTVDNADLGEIVRDGEGRTLYRFTKDTDWPMKSNCVDACLDKWKPAKPVDAGAVEGIDPKLLSTYTRPDDGTEQLALDCWPLYWFTGDQTPGDTNGQGVGGTWFAVKADGSLAK